MNSQSISEEIKKYSFSIGFSKVGIAHPQLYSSDEKYFFMDNNNFSTINIVGKASINQPRLIELLWGNQSNPLITLVGKGVCFDSGGLNIKSANKIRYMKKDMGGAAHVIGLANMIIRPRPI